MKANDFKKRKKILMNYKDSNELFAMIVELDNDEYYPKDEQVEHWKAIIEFCRDDIEARENRYKKFWQRWADEVGV